MKVWESPFIPSDLTFKKFRIHSLSVNQSHKNQTSNQNYLFITTFQHLEFWDVTDRDDAAAPWHLEDVVAVVGHCHKLGQGWIPKDGVVWLTDEGGVEVDELGPVVVVLAEGDREADLPNRCGGTVGHS